MLPKDEVKRIQDEAVAAARNGQFHTAELGFRRIVDCHPTWGQAHANLGSLYLDKIQAEQSAEARSNIIDSYAREANRHFEAALQCDSPPHPRVLLMLGRVQVQLGRWKEGVLRLRQFAARADVSTELKTEAGQLIAAAQLPESAEAADIHDEAYQRGSSLVTPYHRLAGNKPKDPSTAQAKKDLIEGIELLTRATKLNPGNWPAYWLIGMSERALGRPHPEHAALIEAHQIFPEQPDVARELMGACLAIGDTKQALAAAKAAQSASPEDAGLEANLGLALLYDGQTDAALAAAQSALRRAPDDEITKALAEFIEDVRSGKRDLPQKFPPTL